MTTEAGLNRWQAPVINEDHKNGQETAFWGIVIQGTLKRRLSMINFKNFQNFKKDSSITNKWGELFLPLYLAAVEPHLLGFVRTEGEVDGFALITNLAFRVLQSQVDGDDIAALTGMLTAASVFSGFAMVAPIPIYI